jgi:hypothetical protein
MRNRVAPIGSFLLLMMGSTFASTTEPQAGGAEATTSIVCGSTTGERQSCAASTTGGVTLVKSLGVAACELGRTWGYDEKGVWVSDGCGGEFAVTQADAETQTPTEPEPTFGRYTPTGGFKVADTEYGDLNLRVFAYVRYLNQRSTDPAYTNAFGTVSDLQQRNDFQLNKVQIYFFGWLMDPEFRYNMYVWTSNSSQGQVTQVVVAGSLTYEFNDHVIVGGGIGALPGVRSLEGNFPFWLSMDARLIADEYFRPSYTTGVWVNGGIVDNLTYKAMLGNNVSQFGVDAGQLDNDLDTVSASLVWMPTTGEFGRAGKFGDFERHDRLATRVGVHATRSDESRQSQPDTDAFDNVQIRVSDGSVIFAPGLFAPGVQIDEATYALFAIDAGLKYRGVSFDVEHYRRRIDDFSVIGSGVLPFTALRDTGFQAQVSAMVVPDRLQIYGSGSRVYGEYGNPHDVRAGLWFYPWKNEAVRWNVEYFTVRRSPVGALSLPYEVGSDGPIVHSTFMVWF